MQRKPMLIAGLLSLFMAAPSLATAPGAVIVLWPNPQHAPTQSRLPRLGAFAPTEHWLATGETLRFVNPTAHPITVRLAASPTDVSVLVPPGAIGASIQFRAPATWQWAAPVGYGPPRSGAIVVSASSAGPRARATTTLAAPVGPTTYPIEIVVTGPTALMGRTAVEYLVTPTTTGGTLTITSASLPGREMRFHGTLTGSTQLAATMDGVPIADKYIVVDAKRQTWSAKATGLVKGPHTFTASSGGATVTMTVTVPK